MATNTINFIRGTTRSFNLRVTDSDGADVDLTGGLVVLELRLLATDPLPFYSLSSANPAQIVLSPGVAKINFIPSDTSGLLLQKYSYQVKGTLADGTVFYPIPPSVFNVTLGGTASPPPPVFTNTVKFDHNTVLPDQLRYVTPGGSPITDAQIRLYYKSDYVAGNLGAPVGIAMTGPDGRWLNPILAFPGFTYTVQFLKPNEYGPDTFDVTV